MSAKLTEMLLWPYAPFQACDEIHHTNHDSLVSLFWAYIYFLFCHNKIDETYRFISLSATVASCLYLLVPTCALFTHPTPSSHYFTLFSYSISYYRFLFTFTISRIPYKLHQYAPNTLLLFYALFMYMFLTFGDYFYILYNFYWYYIFLILIIQVFLLCVYSCNPLFSVHSRHIHTQSKLLFIS